MYDTVQLCIMIQIVFKIYGTDCKILANQLEETQQRSEGRNCQARSVVLIKIRICIQFRSLSRILHNVYTLKLNCTIPSLHQPCDITPVKTYITCLGWPGVAGTLLELVLEDEEVVGGGYGDDALVRVPRRVQYLLVEVEAVDADFVLEEIDRIRL